MSAARFLVQVTILLAVKASISKPTNTTRMQANPSANTCSQAPTNNCHCQCELRPDSSTANAHNCNALEDKIDQLIALVNRTTLRHSAPGILMGNLEFVLSEIDFMTCCSLSIKLTTLRYSVLSCSYILLQGTV